ncbi:uncharacterized protein LOC6552658 [Drosophila erecta]|uniref:GG21665 n=1 Tax=Drosophila erecta TaxID=7220 RepID=B3P0I9_DROER|nr:uncharacterized protein LOC6552658 [Drosophila erecta]EDV48815.1 uncharacterized protein Dere_GG21665 [Drosophila erecta]
MFRIRKPATKNFYVQNGVAYTEDRKIVRRVTISAKWPFLKHSLLKHFSSFGKVEDLQWNKDTCAGSVFFQEATQAAKALYCTKHNVDGHSLVLQASSSWHQPPEQEEAGARSAYDIPIVDDFWREVITYLPLNSRLDFADSCERFQTVYELDSHRLNHILEMGDVCTLTHWGIKRLMLLSGNHIRCIKGGPLHPFWPHMKQFVQLLGVSCPNLAELNFVRIPLSLFHMTNLFQSANGCSKMTSISMRHCDLTDSHLSCLHSLTALKGLDIRDNPCIQGDTLGTLPVSLEILNVSRCTSLLDTRLVDLGALPLLRELRCSEISQYMENDELFRLLVHSCPMLEVLEMTISSYMDRSHVMQLGGLSRLRTLVLFPSLDPEWCQVNNSLLMSLADLDLLRHLEIHHGHRGFVTSFGLRIISQLKELRTLVLQNQDFGRDELMELRKLNALEFLDLSGSYHLTDEIAAELAKTLGRLRRLKVERCPLISRRLAEILKGNPKLQIDA